MAEELQTLIDRIQKEGVDSAEKQAEDIIAKAKADADRIVKEGEAKAKEHFEKTEKEAEAFRVRSEAAVSQAARDILISVRRGVEKIFENLVKEKTDEALTVKVVATMIEKLAQSAGESTKFDVIVSDEDKSRLVDFFSEQFRHQMEENGIEIKSDNDVVKGLKLRYKDSQADLNFTDEAIAESLSAFLRPQLAEIVKKAAE